MKRVNLFLFVLLSIFLFNSTFIVYADVNENDFLSFSNIKDLKNSLSDDLNLLNEKFSEFNLEILENSDNRNIQVPLIELDSFQELEDLLIDIQNFNNQDKVITKTININSKTISDSYNFQWNDYTFWEKFNGPIYRTFVKKNVTLFYDYIPKKGFTKLRDVKSYFSNFNILCDWEQLGYSYNIYTDSTINDTLQVKIEGKSVLGVNISYGGASFNIGLTTPETWTVKLKLV